MSRSQIVICDLCKKPIETGQRTFKIKEAYLFKSGWERLDAHDDCVRQLLIAAKKSTPSTVQPTDVFLFSDPLPPNGGSSMQDE